MPTENCRATRPGGGQSGGTAAGSWQHPGRCGGRLPAIYGSYGSFLASPDFCSLDFLSITMLDEKWSMGISTQWYIRVAEHFTPFKEIPWSSMQTRWQWHQVRTLNYTGNYTQHTIKWNEVVVGFRHAEVVCKTKV